MICKFFLDQFWRLSFVETDKHVGCPNHLALEAGQLPQGIEIVMIQRPIHPTGSCQSNLNIYRIDRT